MAIRMRSHAAFTRRALLKTAAISAAIPAIGTVARPSLSWASDRPLITHGVQSGDVSVDSGMVWARADRPARMLVEVATTDSFKSIRSGVFVDALPESDFTAKVLIEGLPAAQDIFYRIRFQDLSSPTIVGEPQVGHFRTAPGDRALDLVSSGRAIPRARAGASIAARGGMRTYGTMLQNRPDFFIHSGDNIYADCPMPAELKTAERRNLAQHRHRGEIEAGATPSRSSAAIINTICSTTICAPSTPKCRCSRNGTITK